MCMCMYIYIYIINSIYVVYLQITVGGIFFSSKELAVFWVFQTMII